MGLNARESGSILNSNAALRIIPYESIRNRIRFLQSAGVIGLALSRLIVKHPDILTSEEIDELSCFIIDDTSLELRGKINRSQNERLLTAKNPRFLVGFENKVRLLLQLGIPKENLVHVLNTVNLTKTLCLKPLEGLERMLAFLQRFGGVDLIIRRPAILNLDTQLVPRIGFLLDLSGGDEDATGVVLCKFPYILAYTVDHLNDHVEFLNSYAGLSYEEIFRIVLVYPGLFSTSKNRKLHPRIDFLKQCRLSSNDKFRFLMKAPLFLSLSFEGNLANKLIFLVKIGYENRTKELALAMGAVTKELALAMGAVTRCSLQYNHKLLEKKMDYLIEEMGREVEKLLSFPAFLGYKLDGRIKQRFEEKRKILGKGMSINKLLSVC
ncbi:hypothetical protein OROGR_025880 [Orobanche gracilis]